MAIHSFRDLIAWQKGMNLVRAVYQVSQRLPGDERFGLVSQMRRAAISVPANIAEGHGRSSTADFLRFLDMAIGSCSELETQLLACEMLGYVKTQEIVPAIDLAQECQRVVKGLKTSLLNNPKKDIRT